MTCPFTTRAVKVQPPTVSIGKAPPAPWIMPTMSEENASVATTWQVRISVQGVAGARLQQGGDLVFAAAPPEGGR